LLLILYSNMPARGRLFAGRRRSQRPAQREFLRYDERGIILSSEF
jgi:hypothetical protein